MARLLGKGRVTEQLLSGLCEIAPPGQWILWGPPAVTRYLWEGARAEIIEPNPLAWAGQRQAAALPKADFSLFLHTVRPLHRRRCVVLVHDTIPLRWGGGWAIHQLWRAYLLASTRWSDGVIVYSRATAQRVKDDLGLDPRGRVTLPADAGRAVALRRSRLEMTRPSRPETMIYVGLNRPQKNLERAILAFSRSQFAAAGGIFILVGSEGNEQAALQSFIERHHIGGCEIQGRVSESALNDLYINAAFVIQPSLEEGWGLPIVEALGAGIPVCCSDLAPLTEAADGKAEIFDPYSVPSMTMAIDRTWHLAQAGYTPETVTAPTPRQFARSVLDVLVDVASPHGGSAGGEPLDR